MEKEVKKVEELKEVKVKNFGEKIWDEIEKARLDIFSLPNQTVNMYCSKLAGMHDCLLISVKATAVLPSLESSLPGFDFDLAADGKTITVRRKSK